MKFTRTKAVFALTAAVLVGTAGAAAAAQQKPAEKPIVLTDQEAADLEKNWEEIENELPELTAEDKAVMDKYYADCDQDK